MHVYRLLIKTAMHTCEMKIMCLKLLWAHVIYIIKN